MAAKDPWTWDIDDVQAFVLNFLPAFASSLPNARLPDLDSLSQAFAEAEINGPALLELIDAATLRDEFAIKSFAQRFCILSAISAAKKSSHGHVIYTNSAPIQVNLESASIRKETSPRRNETFVEDATGRKRRRLVLESAATANTGPAPATAASTKTVSVTGSPNRSTPNPETSGGYIRDAALPLETIFYADTPFDTPIPDDNDEDDDDIDEVNFVATQTSFPGDAQYVYAQLKHLSQSIQPRPVKYCGRQTWALYPYRRKLLADGVRPSAIIFPDPTPDSPAMRVDSGQIEVIDSSTDDDDQPHDDNELLLKKYPVNEDDVLPQYNPNQPSDLETVSESESDSDSDIEGEDTDLPALLTDEKIRAIINQEIDEQVLKWRNTKLPNLETNMASRTWYAAKSSHKLRDRWVQEHLQDIRKLDARIQDLAEGIVGSSWTDDRHLRTLCTSLWPSLSAKEQLKWELDVWSRKDAPDREPRRRVQAARSGVKTRTVASPAANHLDDFVVMDDQPDGPADHDSRNEIEIEPEPAAVPAHAEMPFIIDMEEPSPPASPRSHGEDGGGDNEDEDMDDAHDDELDDDAAEAKGVADPSLQEPATPKTEDGPAVDITAIDSDSSLALPSARELASQPRSTGRNKASKFTQSDNVDIVEISSDEFQSPVKTKKKPPVPPERAGPSDFACWSWDDLALENDRKRFMLKLLYSLGRLTMERLRGSLRDIKPKKMPKVLMDFIDRSDQSKHKPENQMMLQWAQLYACWLHIDPKYWDHAFDLSTVEDRETTDISFWSIWVFNALPRLIGFSPKTASDEDTESSEEYVGPRRKRVKTDQNAARQRADADARLKRYTLQQSSADGGLAQLGSSNGHDEIVVNIGKGDDEAPIMLHPYLAARLKPHQVEGLRFLWRETISAQEAEGCLLAHTMGLGKTAQAISLLVTISEAAQDHKTRSQIPHDLRRVTALILVPPSLIANWHAEINRWSPSSVHLPLYICDSTLPKVQRLEYLERWDESGGILIMGHNLFASMLKPLLAEGADQDECVQKISRILLESANIVIADEAHSFKTESAQIHRFVHRIVTPRRIALTGTPLSNNTLELYALVSWISPNFLGPSTEFRHRYATPIEEGLYHDSAPGAYRRSLKTLAALRKVTEPKVHRLDIDVLQDSLPSKTEFVLFVSLTELQRTVYTQYMAYAAGACEGEETISQIRLFGWLAVLKLLCNHPRAFRKRFEAWLATNKHPNKAVRSIVADKAAGVSPYTSGEDDEGVEEAANLTDLGISEIAVHHLLSHISTVCNPAESNKVLIAQDIIRHCKQIGDKVLLFSQSLPTLDLFEEILDTMKIRWGRIDGKKVMKRRNLVLRDLRRNQIDVLLISTRAGGVGLNIQEANRVIIFDFSFNPQWEAQAIGRSYRLGQQKPVFVYRFVAGGTFETKMYNQGLFKTSVAARVLDSKNPARNAKKKVGEWLVPPEPVPQEDIQEERGKDAVMDRIIAKQATNPCIRDIKTMETLTKEVVDAEFNVDEQREVDDMVAHSTARGSGMPPQLMPPLGAMASTSGYTIPYPFPIQTQVPPMSVAPMAGSPAIGFAPNYTYPLPSPSTPYNDSNGAAAGGKARGKGKNEPKPPARSGVEVVNDVLGSIIPGHRSSFQQRTANAVQKW